jgi:hypothetical protein
MIHPAPTSRIDPSLARTTLAELVPASATKPAIVKLNVPNTSYELHLRPTGAITGAPAKRLIGTIAAQARRIDMVETGGRYLEPVYGRPRRVQGTVVSGDDSRRVLVIDAGVPIHLTLGDQRQRPSDFAPGTLVSCDVLDGATFTPQT